MTATAERPSYEEFLRGKAQIDGDEGFEPNWMPEFLFPFQRALTEVAVMLGYPDELQLGALMAARDTGETADPEIETVAVAFGLLRRGVGRRVYLTSKGRNALRRAGL